MEVAGRRVSDDEEQIIEEIVQECEPCKGEHVAATANGICRECEEYMCNTCFRHHLKAKQCRNHVLVDTQSVSLIAAHKSAGNVEKCKHHVNEQIKFYCHTHDIVGCGECMIPDHSGCKSENIKDLAKGFEVSEDFKCLKKKLEGLAVANNENGRKVNETKKANKSVCERALKDIRKFRKDVNDYLDKAEACITSEAKDIENINDKLLNKLDDECKLLSSTISEVEQNLDTELYSENTLFIQTVDCKAHILDIEKRVFRVQTETSIKNYDFVPDKQLQSLLSSTINFGKLASPISTMHTNFEHIELVEEPVRVVAEQERKYKSKGKRNKKDMHRRIHYSENEDGSRVGSRGSFRLQQQKYPELQNETVDEDYKVLNF